MGKSLNVFLDQSISASYTKKGFKIMNVLAIGSHPDDIEIGCFGTLARHNLDGDKIFGVIITKGEKRRHNGKKK